MQSQINTNPLQQFIQQVRATELSQQKEVKVSIQQARLLSLALAEILNKLNQDYESMFNSLKQSTTDSVITVMMDGGTFDART
jgi:hypothetical protein